MNTIDITRKTKTGLRTKRFSGPSSWAELTAAQGVSLMRVRAQVTDAHEVLFVALRMLYNMPPRWQKYLFDARFLRRKGLSDQGIQLSLDLGHSLLETLAWVGDVDPDGSFPAGFRLFDFHYGTPKVLLSRLLHRTCYMGPEAGLGDSTFGEFMAAYQAYHRKDDLPLLAAVLYRPGKDGQRTAFDHKEAIARSETFAKLDPALLERINFGFSCSMLLLQRSFRSVFPPTAEGSTPKKAKGNWLDIAINMAQLDATKVGQIEELNVYLALKVLNTQIQQAEQLESKLKKPAKP